ncbi:MULTISPECIES: trypsin-like serine peptidase [unclassified Nonomuraea]|uniref:trypsin-like serine peptidase n=1 Tax=Nonomuraea sp. NPDC003804 TaxID=3154547 RepID=UPI0033B65005
MHRRLALLSILTLAAGATALPAASAQAGAGPKPVTEEAAETKTEQKAVARYWTPQKMEDAQPLNPPAPRSRAAFGVPGEPTTGIPWEAPPTSAAPTDPQAAQASSGSAWTGGGAITKTAGRVFFTYQGRNASCSGNAVTSANKSVVLTAGHCVKMGGAFHTNWVFVPGYDKGARPYGTWVATKLLTTPQWDAREDINHDVAAVVVAPLQGRALTDVVGGQGVAFNQGRRQQMHSFGYPAAAPYDGSRLIYCSGRTFDDFLMSKDHGLTCNMTGGSSGGPWFVGFDEKTGLGTQNSVNSFKYNFAPNWMFGPYFGAEAQAVYNAAQNTNAL